MKKVLPTLLALLLGFCVTIIHAEPTFAREIVARIYGKDIFRDELQTTGKSLESFIIPPLHQRFALENHLVATDAEIQKFSALMGNSAGSPSTAPASPEEQAMLQAIARDFVMTWKISKALYQKYGGDVIFQQANPQEPVEANYRFLLAQEKAGSFQILDSKARDRFFQYYIQPRSMVIPPSQVNYDKPWWERLK